MLSPLEGAFYITIYLLSRNSCYPQWSVIRKTGRLLIHFPEWLFQCGNWVRLSCHVSPLGHHCSLNTHAHARTHTHAQISVLCVWLIWCCCRFVLLSLFHCMRTAPSQKRLQLHLQVNTINTLPARAERVWLQTYTDIYVYCFKKVQFKWFKLFQISSHQCCMIQIKTCFSKMVWNQRI